MARNTLPVTMKHFHCILIPIAFFLIISCGDKMDLPTPSTGSGNFTAGETTLVRLNPSWDGFLDPVDADIGPDGIVYIADQSNPYITAMDVSGNVLHSGNLDQIGPITSAVGIGVDPRLNVFIVNGSDTVYRWNQYINMYGVEAIAESFVLMDTITGDTSWADFDQAFEAFYSGQTPEDHWIVVDITWEFDQAAIDSLTGVNPFFTATNGSFQGVAASNIFPEIYVTDSGRDRIYRVQVVWDKLLLLGNGFIGFSFTSQEAGLVATHGTGAGTAASPQGISVDDDNRILFAQIDGNFLVQRMREVIEGEGTYTVGFDFTSDVMQLNRFANPLDVVAAPLTEQDLGWIYVADTDSNRIQVFNQNGVFQRNAAVTAIPTATTWTDTIVIFLEGQPPDTTFVERDTVIVVEIPDLLDQPSGLAYHNSVLYICDTGNSRVERYQLSFSKEDLPDE
ncbi:hypothetical protein AMJ86_07050 [bacterium SM23_57]|nr:MAG: hypothetical protein AMJ86_07050 [bacterium SM23_57]